MANVETAAAVATRPRDEWIARCVAAGVAAQPILSPEEGLLDAALEAEGVIVELDDPSTARSARSGTSTRSTASPTHRSARVPPH